MTTDLFFATLDRSFGGGGGSPFDDPSTVISGGSITRIDIRHGDEVDAIRLVYGPSSYGDWHGGNGGIESSWQVPDGHRIVRVEGHAAERVDRIQFFTDQGASSPAFGGMGGQPFAVSDPSGGELRTISGRAGRKLDNVTLKFGAPYYIKDIQYDLDALDRARLATTPKEIAREALTNTSSVTQAVTYSHSEKLTVRKSLTFQQSFGLKFGTTIKISSPEPNKTVESSETTEFTSTTTFGATYEKVTEDLIQWSVPISVPPMKKILATSTIRQFNAAVPFTYTVAWYIGSRDNIVKQVTLSGRYEGVQIQDLEHHYQELPL